MATRNANDLDQQSIPSGEGMLIGIVISDWNSEITNALYDACKKTLLEHGVDEAMIRVRRVPGSFELPMGARLLSVGAKFDAMICLGCIIKGETKHDEYIASAVSNGIMQLSLMSGIPVIFGVLTPENEEQARARAGGIHGNKGAEAAVAALRMAAMKRERSSQPHKIGFS